MSSDDMKLSGDILKMLKKFTELMRKQPCELYFHKHNLMSSFVTCIEKKYTGEDGTSLKRFSEWWWPHDCMDAFVPLSCPLQNDQSQKTHPSLKYYNRKRDLMGSLHSQDRNSPGQPLPCFLTGVHPTNYGSNLFRNQLYPRGKRAVLSPVNSSSLEMDNWCYMNQLYIEYNWVNEKMHLSSC